MFHKGSANFEISAAPHFLSFISTFQTFQSWEKTSFMWIMLLITNTFRISYQNVFNQKFRLMEFDVFFTVHHSIELFQLPTLMHNSLFINNI